MTRLRSPRWLAALAMVSLAACDDQEVPTLPPRPVLTMPLVLIDTRQIGPFGGTIVSRYTSEVGFLIAGRVVTRNKNVGDLVRKGEVLATLDPTQERLRVASMDAALTRTKARAENTTGTEERTRYLEGRSVVPRSQLDDAVAGRDTAAAEVRQAQADLDKARNDEAYTVLYADNDGVMNNWSVEVGQYVAAGQTVATVARPEEPEAVLDLADALMVVTLGENARFVVFLPGAPTTTTEATIREVGAQSDAATRSRRLRLTLADPDQFWPGATVSIKVEAPATPHMILPRSALLQTNDAYTVWLVKDDMTVEPQPVQVLNTTSTEATIAATLPGGARVVTAGVRLLEPGQRVRWAP